MINCPTCNETLYKTGSLTTPEYGTGKIQVKELFGHKDITSNCNCEVVGVHVLKRINVVKTWV